MKLFVVGSINMDLVIEAPFMPENGMTISGSNFMQNPGGKGANQAVAASKLGGNVFMVGGVGSSFSRELKDTLQRYNVNVDYVKKYDNVASGTAVIVIVKNDNRIILDAGANAELERSLIDDAFKNACEGDYLICQLEISQEIVKYAFDEAKKKGMVTFLNPAPAAKIIDGIFDNVDYFIPNQSETNFYTGIYPKNESDSIKAILKLKEKGIKNVIITLGTKGSCTIIDNDYIHVDAYKVDTLDTTAAGDTYIGAFAVGLSENMSLKDAMDFASKASSITVTRRGAQKSIPYRNEI